MDKNLGFEQKIPSKNNKTKVYEFKSLVDKIINDNPDLYSNDELRTEPRIVNVDISKKAKDSKKADTKDLKSGSSTSTLKIANIDNRKTTKKPESGKKEFEVGKIYNGMLYRGKDNSGKDIWDASGGRSNPKTKTPVISAFDKTKDILTYDQDSKEFKYYSEMYGEFFDGNKLKSIEGIKKGIANLKKEQSRLMKIVKDNPGSKAAEESKWKIAIIQKLIEKVENTIKVMAEEDLKEESNKANKGKDKKPEVKKLEKISLKTAFISYSEKLTKEYAREMADRKMSHDFREDKNKGFFGKINHFFKRIWKYGAFKEYYRQKEVSKFKKEIVQKGNMFVDEDLTINSQSNLNNAIIDRLINIPDLNDAIHGGENVRMLQDGPIKDEIIQAIRDYAKGDSVMTSSVFIDTQKRLSERIKAENPDIFGESALDANNLLETAKIVRASVANKKGIDSVEIDLQIIIGDMRAGLRTEQKLNTVDRIVDKLHQTKLGSLVNEDTVSSALAILQGIGNSLGSMFLFNKAASWGSFGATAVLAGTFGAIRSRNDWEQRRVQHFRDMASGRGFDDKDKHRLALERFRYDGLKVTDAIKTLETNTTDLANKGHAITPDNISSYVAHIADMEARIKLSDDKSIDLLLYSGPQNIDKERTKLDINRSKFKVALRKICEEKNIHFGSFTFDEYLDNCTTAQKTKLLENDNGIKEKDAQFRGFKNGKALKSFCGSALRSVVFGIAFQEVGAIFNPHQQGALESLWHKDVNPVGTTFLKGISDRINGHIEGATHSFELKDNMSFRERPSYIHLNDAKELRLDRDGNYDLWIRGEKKFENIFVFDKNKLVYNEEALRANDIVFNASSANVATPGSLRSVVDAKQLTDNHPNMVDAHRDIWLHNNTRGVYDLNEAGLHYHIAPNGKDIIVDISGMTSKGSSAGNISIDPIQAIKDNKLMLWVSQTRNSSGRAFEIPFDSKSITISEQSPIYNMFDIHNGKVGFNGGFVEVVNKDNLVSVLATHEGANSLNNFVINSNSTIPEAINTLRFSQLSADQIPMAVPLPVFVTYGKPLTSAKAMDVAPAGIMPTNVNVVEKTVKDRSKKWGTITLKPNNTEAPNKSKKETKEPTGLEASYQLAKIAKSKNIDLSSLGKDEYMNFAFDNYIGLDRNQLIQAPLLRTATSEEQYIKIRDGLTTQVENSQAYQAFDSFTKDIKSRAVDGKPVEFAPEINILPKSKKTKDWLYFRVNDGVKLGKNTHEILKTYITFKDLSKFDLMNFINFMGVLRDQKFNIDIKIFQDIASQGSIMTDQVVIHGNDNATIKEVANLASTYFGNQILKPSLGLDIVMQDGSIVSYSSKVSEDLKAHAKKK